MCCILYSSTVQISVVQGWCSWSCPCACHEWKCRSECI